LKKEEKKEKKPVSVFELGNKPGVLHVTDDPEGYLAYDGRFGGYNPFLIGEFEDFDSAMKNYETEMNWEGEPYLVGDWRDPEGEMREAVREQLEQDRLSDD